MRGVWFVAGTAAGIYVTTKARQAAESLTVDGLHDRLTGLFAGARVLRDEVRNAAAERETELRARVAAVPDGTSRAARQLTAGGLRALGDAPARPAEQQHEQRLDEERHT